MKHLSVIFMLIAIITGIWGIKTHRRNQQLRYIEAGLQKDIADLKSKVASVDILECDIPENIERTYCRLFTRLIVLNQQLGLNVNIKAKGTQDYDTIKKSIKLSNIAGVRKVDFLLDFSSKIPSSLYVISELQKSFPVAFQELRYAPAQVGIMFSLYGL